MGGARHTKLMVTSKSDSGRPSYPQAHDPILLAGHKKDILSLFDPWPLERNTLILIIFFIIVLLHENTFGNAVSR